MLLNNPKEKDRRTSFLYSIIISLTNQQQTLRNAKQSAISYIWTEPKPQRTKYFLVTVACDSSTTCSIIPLQLHSCCQFHMPCQAGAAVNYLFSSEKSPSLTLGGLRTCPSAAPIFIWFCHSQLAERYHKAQLIHYVILYFVQFLLCV